MNTLDQLFLKAQTLAKSAPNDIGARSALWQIFAARGEYDRARKQLDLMVKIDSSWMMEVGACHRLITAEEGRAAMFTGAELPVCLGTPPEWFAPLLRALPLLSAGDTEAALLLFRQVRELAYASGGSANGEKFGWACDGDARLGPCLEIIAQGKYFWVPWESVQSLESAAPTEIRDRLWQQTMLQVRGEDAIEVFIPVRYPTPRDDAEMMSRVTNWESLDDEFFIGFGQKCLVTDQADVGFLDMRHLEFDEPGSSDRAL